MRRDTKIVLAFLAAIPSAVLGAAALCTSAIAAGASMQWRLLFRLFCHQRAERCLELFDVPMPLCARCTAIYAGMLAGILAFCVMPWLRARITGAVLFAAATPLAIDGLTQLTGLRESTNPLRVATGIIAGLAFGFWVLCAVERAGERSSHVLDLT